MARKDKPSISGNDVFSRNMGVTDQAPAPEGLEHPSAWGEIFDPPEEANKRNSFSFTLRKRTIDRLRNASYWSRESMSAIAEEAILEKLEAMETDQGHPFAPIPEAKGVRKGRPPGR